MALKFFFNFYKHIIGYTEKEPEMFTLAITSCKISVEEIPIRACLPTAVHD